MTDALINARRRRDEVVAEIGALEEELKTIDLFVQLHEKFSRTNHDVTDDKKEHSVSVVPNGVEPGRGKRRGRPADFAEIMKRLLSEVDHALSRQDLSDLLEKRGIPIPSNDKARYLGTILWRHRDVFRNLPGHGYWLKDRPYPPAGYDPATAEPASVLDMETDIIQPPDVPHTLTTELLVEYNECLETIRGLKDVEDESDLAEAQARAQQIEERFPQVLGRRPKLLTGSV